MHDTCLGMLRGTSGYTVLPQFLAWLNSIMNGLIKQLVTLDFPVDQLAAHKTESLRRNISCGLESYGIAKKLS